MIRYFFKDRVQGSFSTATDNDRTDIFGDEYF